MSSNIKNPLWSMMKITNTSILITLTLLWMLAALIDGAGSTAAADELDQPLMEPADIFLVDLLSMDARTFSASEVMSQADVHLVVRSSLIARTFRDTLREGMTCDPSAKPKRTEYQAVIRFRGTNGKPETYLTSRQYVESATGGCRKEMDGGLRKMLSGLLLTNDAVARFPELGDPNAPAPQSPSSR